MAGWYSALSLREWGRRSPSQFVSLYSALIDGSDDNQVYIICAIAFGLILWLVPQFYVSAVAVSLQGFFLGPLFPAAVVVTTKLLPKHLHVSSIGFAAAFGAGGAAVLPFAVGAIAQAKGVKVLQPFIIGLAAGILLLWLGLPRVSKVGRE